MTAYMKRGLQLIQHTRYNLECIYMEILLSSIENCLDTYTATEQRVGKKCMYTCKSNLVPMLFSGKNKNKNIK